MDTSFIPVFLCAFFLLLLCDTVFYVLVDRTFIVRAVLGNIYTSVVRMRYCGICGTFPRAISYASLSVYMYVCMYVCMYMLCVCFAYSNVVHVDRNIMMN